MIVVLASLTLLSVQPGMLARKAARIRTSLHHEVKGADEPDNHYPLTCAPAKWLGNLPFFAFAWKRSEELESYDVL